MGLSYRYVSNDGALRSRYAVLLAVGLLIAPRAETAVLEEIVVTAQKREQDLDSTPVSVSVLSGTRAEQTGVIELADVAAQVASFAIVDSTGPVSTSLLIRRIGNEGSIPNFEPAVGVFMDGAPLGRTGSLVADLFDVSRIEVVRGPQTTLYGKNTTAGVVNILSRPPEDEFRLRGKLSAGAFDGAQTAGIWRGEGIVNIPVTDTLSARAGIAVYDHEPTLVNTFNGQHSDDMQRYSGRGQLLYRPGRRLSVRLIANRFRIDSARAGDIVIDGGDAISELNSAFGVSCPTSDIDRRLFCSDRAGRFDLAESSAIINIAWRNADWQLDAISSWQDFDSKRVFDADQLNVDLLTVHDRQDARHWSQEVRLGHAGRTGFSWLAGLLLQQSRFIRGDSSEPTATLGTAAPNLLMPQGLAFGEIGDSGFFESLSRSRHASLFAAGNWRVTHRLTMSMGVRWLREKKSSVIRNTADHDRPTAITMLLLPAAADADLSRTTSGSSWTLNGQWHWHERSLSFLQLTRGFKGGGFNAGFGNIRPADREYGDEHVDSVELGHRVLSKERRNRLSVAAFVTRYTDFQSAGWVSLRFLVNNAERVDVSGFEADFESALSEHWLLAMSLSYVNARYKSYTGGSCSYDRAPDSGGGSACSHSGSRLPLAPLLTGHVGLEYRRETVAGEFLGYLGWRHSGGYWTNASLDSRHYQDSINVLHLRAGLRMDRWEVVAWVRNLNDEMILTRQGPSNLFPRDRAFGSFAESPRSAGLTVSVQF